MEKQSNAGNSRLSYEEALDQASHIKHVVDKLGPAHPYGDENPYGHIHKRLFEDDWEDGWHIYKRRGFVYVQEASIEGRNRAHAAWSQLTEERDKRDLLTLTLGEQVEIAIDPTQKRLSSDNPPLPGDICWVMPVSGETEEELKVYPRLAVVRVAPSKKYYPKSFGPDDDEDEYASVALISAEPYDEKLNPWAYEVNYFAGPTDVILDQERTGIPYDVIVETDVVGPVYFEQLSQPVGQVSQEDLDGIIETEFTGIPAVPDAWTGMPIKNPEKDVRWNFKLSEGDIMHRLIARKFQEMLD